MRRSRLHPLIVVLCALFLIGAQQAAYAHFLGHLGCAAETQASDRGDAGHDAGDTLSHVCTTCAAFAALDAAPPVVAMPLSLASAATTDAPPALAERVTARTARPYAARAPPAVL